MAVNYCDGFMFMSVPTVYPIYAVKGAVSSGAGWFSLAFVPVGLAIGVAIVWVGRPVVYAVVGFGGKRCEKVRPEWLQRGLFLPFFIWYLIAPWVFIGLGVFASWFASGWLAKHIF
jgi:hypothetical protein